ncbi:MAG TPA: type II toxin-antitoxin system Phd/YefM family antitoxin [Acidobacteriaceae bacterium]|nr:type II toxin-antitoxin system Phd/YefM family antitoxin [Acidobacteriaceae bacterium]
MTSVQKSHSASAISVADAKSNFSSVLSRVAGKRLPITILRRGKPIAQIVPIAIPKGRSHYGYMEGSARETGDIVGPTGEEWTLSNE